MKKLFIALCLIASLSPTFAQQEVLRLSIAEAEKLFLERNYFLLAEKYKIDQAKAEIIQARLWNNPTLEVAEVNLWSNPTAETYPHLFGKYGQHQQIAIAIEQVIETAGKRKKRIELEKLNHQSAELEFEETLRNLKYAFRNTLIESMQLQKQWNLIEAQAAIFGRLAVAYEKQWQQGNISEANFIRIKAESLNYKNELKELKQDIANNASELNTYLALDPKQHRVEIIPPASLKVLALQNAQEWEQQALQYRADYKLVKQQSLVAKQQLKVEKAEKMPNLTFGVNYDRGGNIMQDFIGIGATMDLPFFNRNQGKIKVAELEIKRNEQEQEYSRISISNELKAAVSRLESIELALQDWNVTYERQLDKTLDNYSKNLQNKNLSMVEYLDFVDAYLDNKKNFLQNQEDYLKGIEELQFIIGTDIL